MIKKSKQLKLLGIIGIFIAILSLSFAKYVHSWNPIGFLEGHTFCGKICHNMDPELVSVKNSKHSNTHCGDCHVGDGVDYFWKAKTGGIRQAYQYIWSQSYHTPIQVPVHNLRPAIETCGHCHQPEVIRDKKIKNIIRFNEDRNNTPTQKLIQLRLGSALPGEEWGIHRHYSDNFKITYISEDHHIENGEDNDEHSENEKAHKIPGGAREKILWVMLEKEENGVQDVKIWTRDNYEPTIDQIVNNSRVMDCTDCHNRVGHPLKTIDNALDEALQRGFLNKKRGKLGFGEGRIDPSIPFIKKNAKKLLKDEADRMIKKVDGEKFRFIKDPEYKDAWIQPPLFLRHWIPFPLPMYVGTYVETFDFDKESKISIDSYFRDTYRESMRNAKDKVVKLFKGTEKRTIENAIDEAVKVFKERKKVREEVEGEHKTKHSLDHHGDDKATLERAILDAMNVFGEIGKDVDEEKLEKTLLGVFKLVSATEEVFIIFKNNIFPFMKVDWGTYPDHSSHSPDVGSNNEIPEFPGCMRCHNDSLKNISLVPEDFESEAKKSDNKSNDLASQLTRELGGKLVPESVKNPGGISKECDELCHKRKIGKPGVVKEVEDFIPAFK